MDPVKISVVFPAMPSSVLLETSTSSSVCGLLAVVLIFPDAVPNQRPGTAALQMRKFGTWYVKGLKSAATLRTVFQKISSESDFEVVIERILEADYQQGLRDPGEPSRGA